jgi:outer membrane protein assembly factor BamD (BamD/ComL family)
MNSVNGPTLEKRVEDGLLWIRAHQERFWTVTGVVVLAVLFGVFAVQQHEHQLDEAWTQLGAVQSSILQNQLDAAKKSLADWQTRYGSSGAKTYADFLRADLLSKTSDYASAAQVYAQLAASGRPAVVQPLALSAEISSEEMAGNLAQARATAQRFIDKYPDHFFAASAYLSQARLAELSGDQPAATAIYERFVILYPQSPWTESIKTRLQTLTPALPVH